MYKHTTISCKLSDWFLVMVSMKCSWWQVAVRQEKIDSHTKVRVTE